MVLTPQLSIREITLSEVGRRLIPKPRAKHQVNNLKPNTKFQLTLRTTASNNSVVMKSPRFLLRGFRRPSELASHALGHLERQVLEEIWRHGETSVRDVFVSFNEQVAYTTVMTTLDRLYKKRLLSRRKDGRAFIYAALVTREEFEQGIAEDVIDGLLGRGASRVEPVLACIVDAVSEHDRELLDELDRLVKEKRAELKEN